ncbi:MAG: hypothetical protein WAL55_08370 [Candidatus Acidiferrales bacterium]
MSATPRPSDQKSDARRNKRLIILGVVLAAAFVVWIFTMLRA